MGFIAYKMRPGIGPEKDIETIRKMRNAAGQDMGLMIDAHTWWRMGDYNYDFDTILEMIGQLAPYQPVWLEEPLPPEDHALYRKLKMRSPIELASGEHENDNDGFCDLIESEAVDVVQMDILCQGGVQSAQAIFQAVQNHKLSFAFHSWGTELEVLTAAHLGICWPEAVVEWLEYPCYSNGGKAGMYPFPLSDEILKEPLNIENGNLRVDDSPGIGIDVDLSVVNRYPYKSGPWSFFYLKSPEKTIAVTGDHSIKWVEEKSDD
jgi:L-alanine-DL-glutamate epimerase-like enolase superfamily enzyme